MSEGISLHVLSADLNTNEPITSFEQNNGHNNSSHKKQSYLWYSQKCSQASFHPGINPVSSTLRKKQREGRPAMFRHCCRKAFKGATCGRSCGQVYSVLWSEIKSLLGVAPFVGSWQKFRTGCSPSCPVDQSRHLEDVLKGVDAFCRRTGWLGLTRSSPLSGALWQAHRQNPGFHALAQMPSCWPKFLQSGLVAPMGDSTRRNSQVNKIWRL